MRAASMAGTLVAAALAAGCAAPTEPLPRDEGRGAPVDGELSVYDVVARDGTLLGRTAVGWRAGAAEGERELLRGKPRALLDAATATPDATGLDGALTIDTQGPLRAWRGAGDKRVEATWDRSRGVVVMKRTGGEETIAVPAGARDNDELLEAVRRAALEPGDVRRIAVFNGGMSTWIPAEVARLGEETIDTPLGALVATDVRLGFGTSYHHVFVEQAAPHRVVRYDNAGGVRLVLRSYRAARADTAPVETEVPEAPKPAPKAALLAAVALVQWPLMLGLPLLLAFRLRKRLALPWSVWGLGALGFILSQVVHLPLNWALGLMGSPRWLGMATPTVVAIALGGTAGLCEELVRWQVLRRLARKGHAGERVGLVAGAGHGGIESLVFGFLAASTTVSLLVLPLLPPSWIGIPPDQVGEVMKQAVVYWATPWWEPVAAGVERISAMTFHIGMSVLIAWGMRRGHTALAVTAAVVLHAALDAAVVYAAPRIGMAALEGALFAAAAISGVLTWRALRRAPDLKPEA